MSATRKANQRARLKKVDAVIEAVRASGVECAALVSIFFARRQACSEMPIDESSSTAERARNASPR